MTELGHLLFSYSHLEILTVELKAFDNNYFPSTGRVLSMTSTDSDSLKHISVSAFSIQRKKKSSRTDCYAISLCVRVHVHMCVIYFKLIQILHIFLEAFVLMS